MTLHLTPPASLPLSSEAQRELDYALRTASQRGGYIWEGARLAYESGEYKDSSLDELIRAGFLVPHRDPKCGWIPHASPLHRERIMTPEEKEYHRGLRTDAFADFVGFVDHRGADAMTPEEKEALRETRNDARGAFILLAFAIVTIAGGLVFLFRWVSG